jgi:uncharacterized RDD family membrane protein YckC
MGTCSACGREVMPGENFCSNCGAPQGPAPAQVSADPASHSAAAAAFDGQPAAAATAGFGEPAAGARMAQPDMTRQPPGQFPAGPFAPPGGAADTQAPLVSAPAVNVSSVPARGAAGPSLAAATCPNCGQPWSGAQSCGFCGQLWGLPIGFRVSSAGRRFGGYLLDLLLIVCTLVIGWFIWTLVVWAQGQTPAKQLLGMRVIRLDTRTYAGWGRMFLRDFVGKGIVWLIGYLILFIGAVIADCWLLWDKDKQELWDKLAGTVVVDDPQKRLGPSPQVTT